MRIIIIFLLLIPVGGLAAQRGTDSVTFEATLGGGHGSGMHRYAEPGAVAGTVLLGLRSAPGAPRGRIYAITAGGQSNLDFGDKCQLASPTASGCLPEFPPTSHVAVLIGQEWRSLGGEIRAMIGPAAFFGGSTGLGPQAVLDGAMGTTHLELVAALHGSYDFRFDGERLRLMSFEFGLRIQ
jgi:hypothetical protein